MDPVLTFDLQDWCISSLKFKHFINPACSFMCWFAGMTLFSFPINTRTTPMLFTTTNTTTKISRSIGDRCPRSSTDMLLFLIRDDMVSCFFSGCTPVELLLRISCITFTKLQCTMLLRVHLEVEGSLVVLVVLHGSKLQHFLGGQSSSLELQDQVDPLSWV